jgi:anti-sigma regulatory factor (Ser/Thr protein kinase)
MTVGDTPMTAGDHEERPMKEPRITEKCEYRLPLPPHKIASRQAHRVLEWALSDWRVEGEAADNTRVVLSELVANALAHSFDVFRLGLSRCGDQILVEVWDSADALPYVGLPDGLAVDGRGMFLVEALCKEWGVRPEEAGGKTVWAKVAR